MAIWRDVSASNDFPARLTKEYDEQIVHTHAEHTVNVVLTQGGNHFNYRLPTGSEVLERRARRKPVPSVK